MCDHSYIPTIETQCFPSCLVKKSKYIWDPARGGVLEGGGPGGGLPSPGTAAVSKHQAGTVTKQTTGARWGGSGGGVTPPRHGCCVQASDRYCD